MAGQDSSLTSSSGSSSEDGQLAAGVAEHANTALRSTSEWSQETYKSGVRWQIKAWSNEWSRAWVRWGFGLMIQGSPLQLVGVMTQSPGAQRDKAKHWVGAMLNRSSFFFSPLNVFFFALRLLNELMIFGGFFFSKDPKMFFKTLLKAVDKKQPAGQLDLESRGHKVTTRSREESRSVVFAQKQC